jgi:hypothetical protein
VNSLPVKFIVSVTSPSAMFVVIRRVWPSTRTLVMSLEPIPCRSTLPVYAPGVPVMVIDPGAALPSGSVAVKSYVPTGLKAAVVVAGAGGGVTWLAGAVGVSVVRGVAAGLVAQPSENDTSSSRRGNARMIGPRVAKLGRGWTPKTGARRGGPPERRAAELSRRIRIR